MPHERSETIQTDEGWINIYGVGTPRVGERLRKRYSFEQDTYPTLKSAVHAARKRSQAEGRRARSGEPQER